MVQARQGHWAKGKAGSPTLPKYKTQTSRMVAMAKKKKAKKSAKK